MEKITSFERNTVRVLRDNLNADIAALGEKYGITLHLGNASFTDTSVVFKLEATIAGGQTIKQQKVGKDLELYASIYLQGVDLTKTYKHPHPDIKTFKLVGWNSRGREYPVIVEGGDGKKYKLSIDQVKRYAQMS